MRAAENERVGTRLDERLHVLPEKGHRVRRAEFARFHAVHEAGARTVNDPDLLGGDGLEVAVFGACERLRRRHHADDARPGRAGAGKHGGLDAHDGHGELGAQAFRTDGRGRVAGDDDGLHVLPEKV